MVVILILEEQKDNEPRHPPNRRPIPCGPRSAFLIRRGDGTGQTPALISLVESRVPPTLKMVPGLRGRGAVGWKGPGRSTFNIKMKKKRLISARHSVVR